MLLMIQKFPYYCNRCEHELKICFEMDFHIQENMKQMDGSNLDWCELKLNSMTKNTHITDLHSFQMKICFECVCHFLTKSLKILMNHKANTQLYHFIFCFECDLCDFIANLRTSLKSHKEKVLYHKRRIISKEALFW